MKLLATFLLKQEARQRHSQDLVVGLGYHSNIHLVNCLLK